MQIATLNGIEPDLALSVVTVESGGNINAIGTHGELGLFQVMKNNFPGLNKKKLLDPYVNSILGINLLAEAKRNCKHKIDHLYLLCYNLGQAKASKVKFPKKWPYYNKVISEYKKRKKYFINEISNK